MRKSIGQLCVLDDPHSDVESQSSSVRRMKTIEAITATLETVFAQSTDNQSNKSTKRTVLKRSAGQIMTEKDVIEQIEEKQRKTSVKSTARKSSRTIKAT